MIGKLGSKNPATETFISLICLYRFINISLKPVSTATIPGKTSGTK